MEILEQQQLNKPTYGANTKESILYWWVNITKSSDGQFKFGLLVCIVIISVGPQESPHIHPSDAMWTCPSNYPWLINKDAYNQ